MNKLTERKIFPSIWFHLAVEGMLIFTIYMSIFWHWAAIIQLQWPILLAIFGYVKQNKRNPDNTLRS